MEGSPLGDTVGERLGTDEGDFVGEELRLVRSVSRVVKQRLAEAESSREADTQAAAAHQRSVISSVMASVDADSHAGANGTVSEPTTPEARP